jgi:CheY-like chemotaxis protein/nitrogen-specific signal transduction histidine kinase
MHMRAEVVRSSAAEAGRVIGITQDVTDRKHAADIESQARRAAEEASRAKDEFLAMVSHDLRNPLTSILGWAAVLRSVQLPQRVNHAVEVIERNARVETQLVESLLDLSRIAAGKLELDTERVDLLSVVLNVVDSFRPAADIGGITLDAELPSDPVVLIGDSARLQQILSNLLANAIKFSSRSGHVKVRLNHIGSKAQIEVTDDGVGIDPDFLPHVFDRFRQANSAKGRTKVGLGLGLTIVRELVQAHGGNVVANSAGKGCGSKFTVTLPIPAVIPTHIEPADTQAAGGEQVSIAGIRALIVDDDADARELIALTLQSVDAIGKSASSAREALDDIVRERPDVLIADIGMPNEDGYELIQKLRRLEGGSSQKRLPAIALTGYASAADRERALTAGYDLHLTKPVRPADLAVAVSTIVARSDTDDKSHAMERSLSVGLKYQ